MLSKMNLISVVQQLPKEDIETIQGYVEMIEEENQELKLELSGYRQAILNNKEMLGLKEKNQELKKQNQELKKQLEEINKFVCKCGYTNIEQVMLNYCGLLTQQKEFINYLEDLIKQNETVVEVSKYGIPKNCSKLLIDFYKEILQKYKEIIGISNENNIK